MTTFILCILVSVFAWVASALSRVETDRVKFAVGYENLPADRVVSNRLPDSVTLLLETTGFNLVRYKWESKHDRIILDASDLQKHGSGYFYFTLDNQRNRINRQVSYARIVRMSPDTVFLSFSKKVVKSVPVKPKVSLSFAPQFHLSDSIRIHPSMVKVSGSSELIEKVNEIIIDLNFRNLNKTVVKSFPVRTGEFSRQLEFSADSIRVTIPVAEYTEGLMTVPIEILNVPGNYQLKIFPSEVTIRYQVAFDKFNSVKPEQFRAVVDYSKVTKGDQRIKVELLQKPSYVLRPRITPEKVEFLPIREE